MTPHDPDAAEFPPDMPETIGPYFRARAAQYAARPFLAAPADDARPWHPAGMEMTFDQAARAVARNRQALKDAGYGHGHRVAVLLGNRPEMLLWKLALADLGISWVPVNPDYRPAETAYLLQDCGADLCLATKEMAAQMADGIAESGCDIALALIEDDALAPAPRPAPLTGPVTPQSEASLIYTSGTTGRPKGCILSHQYELLMGEWYAGRGGLIQFDPGGERIYCPLPLFHVNAGILLFFAVIATGSTQIIPDRFSARAWWPDIIEMRASVAHYLGIIIPALMKQPPGPLDRAHSIKWAVGAGVEPTLHGAFEERFGFPLIEVWGMTEMCRILGATHEPRQIDTRAIGRACPGLEVRVVDDDGAELPPGTAGEMVLRHSASTPRRGAFSGYLNLPEATEEAWRGGWLHTGDTVTMDESGTVFFVDRRKNIVRRSGENIAAAEVEACLLAHSEVTQVAVIAVPDPIRDEEVMACVVASAPGAGGELARRLFDHAMDKMAYYKAPGWIVFVDDLPVTGTQKIQKHAIFGTGQDPCQHPRAHDLRQLKKRRPGPAGS